MSTEIARAANILLIALLVTGCAGGGEGAMKGAAGGALAGAASGLVSALVWGGDPGEYMARGATAGATIGAIGGAVEGSARARAEQDHETAKEHYALAGLWVQALTFEDQGDRAGLDAIEPEIIRWDRSIDDAQQFRQELDAGYGELVQIRKEHSLPPGCS